MQNNTIKNFIVQKVENGFVLKVCEQSGMLGLGTDEKKFVFSSINDILLKVKQEIQ